MSTALNPADLPRVDPQMSWQPFGQLPDGPLDLVGDVHGEIDALNELLTRLGYLPDGRHEEGRRLIFLGDLIDRGPDSQAVVRAVAGLVDRGRALVVLGNHDLSAVAERQKKENTWLFGHGPVSEAEKPVTSDRDRQEILEFLRRQPLALQRPDLRVVHACWDDRALEALRGERGPKEALDGHYSRIKAGLPRGIDPVERTLALQNENPVKLITSGPENKAPAPFFAGGKMRQESRHPWWQTYKGPFVVFGHYWRIPISGIQKDDGLFNNAPLHSTLGRGDAMCIDYSVGGRWFDRREGRPTGPFAGRLAALRWPERELVFDNGERRSLAPPVVQLDGSSP